MATNKNFEVKNGLTIAGTERISSAGAFTGSLASATTATTQSATDNSTKIATTAYTDAAITAVIGGAPGTLDTLNELAAAINDDASYASTLTTSLATKAPLTSPDFLIGAGEANGVEVHNTNGQGITIFTDTTSANADVIINAADAATSTLKFRNAGNDRLAITTSGIDVTGTATVDGLTLGSNHRIQGTGGLFIGGSTATVFEVGAGSEKMRLTSVGLGLGNINPASYRLDVIAPTNYRSILIGQAEATGTKRMAIAARHYDSSEQPHNLIGIFTDAADNSILTIGGGLGSTGDFNSVTQIQLHTGNGTTTNTTAAMTLDSSGNVGIGATSPSKPLHLRRTSGWATMRLEGASDSGGELEFYKGSTKAGGIFFNNSNDLNIRCGNTETMRIDSSGIVGIGVTPKTDWNTGYDAIQIGESSAFFANSAADEIFMSQNARYTSGSWKYNSSGTAALFDMQAGITRWRRAASGSNDGTISWSDSMNISANGALHIDNTTSYAGKQWVNEAVGGSTPVGGSSASGNTYQKLRLFVNGDINVNQGRGLHFGDVTNTAPMCIREGLPIHHGTDRDWLEIWSRKQLTLTSSYTPIAPGDTSTAGTARSSGFYIKKSGQMGGTWTEVITTPNGGDQTCRVFEDWTGRWVMVGRFASDARTSIQGTWGSVSGLSTAVAQSTATAFSSDWGDIYPSEVRVMGCTDVDEYMDTRTIDFVYGNRPSGVHAYTPRQWKHFFAGQNADGMTQNAGGSPRYGFTMGYSYDGKGRWYNPNQHGMGMSDANVTNPRAAYTTPTANAFNWNNASDAKLLATHYRTFASQDVYQTTGFGADDNVQGFYDSYPTEYTNMGGGTNGAGVHATFSSAVFILLKLNW